jgi:hypothetical protein
MAGFVQQQAPFAWFVQGQSEFGEGEKKNTMKFDD